ncbi:MAG: PAS sensor histidine kinase [uncultured archaeon A07HN63]|nr:MAG: PAS sensor histidine kinase [uncultured archaeon A07HN63]
MQTTEHNSVAIQCVGPDSDTVRNLIRDPIAAVFGSTALGDDASESPSAGRNSSATRLVACTATAVASEAVPAAELRASERVLVVDTGSATDIDLAALPVPTSYIHAESPPVQIRSQLRTIAAATQHDTTAPDADQSTPTPTAPIDDVWIDLPIPVVVSAVDTRTVVAANDAAASLFEPPRSALVGSSPTELHPVSAADTYETLLDDAIETGHAHQPATGDGKGVTIAAGDGSSLPVDYNAVTTTIDGSEYLIETFEDATDRLAQETDRQQQAVAMDTALTGISILSPSSTYTYMNEAHAAIFDHEPGDLLGETWRAIYDDEQQAHIESEVLPVVEATGSWDGDLTGQRADGSPVEQHVSLTALPDGGLVCVNRDITDRKRTERQLRQLRETVSTFMLAEDRTAVIETAVESITETLSLPVVGYYRHDDDTLRPESISSTAATVLDDQPVFEAGDGLVWRAVETGESAYYPDVTERDDCYNPETVLRSEFHLPVGDDGIFIIASTTPDDITEAERDLLGVLVDHVETALTLRDRTTQLQQARQTAEAERQQLRDVIDAVPQLICATDQTGELMFANAALADAYDMTVAELEGSADADIDVADPEHVAAGETDTASIEPGESVHTWGTSLTNVAADDRLFETWTVGFEPVDADDTAVLSVSNDVTELEEATAAVERLRRLKAHYKIGDELLQTRTTDEVCTIGSQAIVDGLPVTATSVYMWDEAETVLAHVSSAPAADAPHPTRITIDDTARWRAFTEGTVTVSDSGEVSVPIGSDGLLVTTFTADSPSTEAVEFLESAADTLAVGIRQARQKASIDDLRAETEAFMTDISRQRTLLDSYTSAIETVVSGESRVELFETLTDFCETNWAYGWVGTYQPQAETVTPTVVSSTGGPATTVSSAGDTGRTPPMLAAAVDREPVYTENTRSTRQQSNWGRQLLTYGYQSAIALPICDSGAIHGVLEVTATATEGFDTQARQMLAVLCQAVAIRLDQLHRAEPMGERQEAVLFELLFDAERPVFSSLPDDATVEVLTIDTVDSDTRKLTLRIAETTADQFQRHVDKTPGLSGFQVAAEQDDTDSVLAAVRLTTTAREPTRQLFEILEQHAADIVTLHSQPTNEVVQIESHRPAVVREIVDRLRETVNCQLVSKQTAAPTDLLSQRTQITDALTDRQHELFRTAYKEGYYKQPKGISGDDLAALFDISQSTVHEHLRAAEQRVATVLFDDSAVRSDAM